MVVKRNHFALALIQDVTLVTEDGTGHATSCRRTELHDSSLNDSQIPQQALQYCLAWRLHGVLKRLTWAIITACEITAGRLPLELFRQLGELSVRFSQRATC